MFVYLITKCTVVGIKVFLKASIGRRQPELAILHRDITGHFIKKLLVALLGAVQFFPQTLDFGNIGRYLYHQLHIAILIANRCGVDHNRRFITAYGFNNCPGTQSFATVVSLAGRTIFPGAGIPGIDLPALATDFIAQAVPI